MYLTSRSARERAPWACFALALLSLLVPQAVSARSHHHPARCRAKAHHRKRHCARRHDRLSRHDTTPPSAPTGLTGSAGDKRVSLAWTKAHDNVGVAGYRVYHDGTRIGSTTHTTYAVKELHNGTSYSFYVKAYDAAGNFSGRSSAISATPQAPTSQPGAPPSSPTPGGAPGSPSPSPQTAWVAPGSKPLSDARAAAQVTPQLETRSANASANDYVPTDAELSAFYSAKNNYGQPVVQWNPLLSYVTGRPGLSHPSTDDLIQWVAHKWGIPEDWIRAEMVTESWWRMSTLGDRTTVSSSWYSMYPPQARVAGTSDVYESLGIAQVRWIPDGSVGAGTEPLRWKSTAFNLDYYAATLRYYYDGLCSWCTSGYGAGQAWNSVGAWFSPYPWNNSGAQSYIHNVQTELANRTWASSGF
jgi:hypothetical protein